MIYVQTIFHQNPLIFSHTIVMHRSIYMLCMRISHKYSNYSVLKIGEDKMDYIQGFDRKQEILFPAKIDDYIVEENMQK